MVASTLLSLLMIAIGVALVAYSTPSIRRHLPGNRKLTIVAALIAALTLGGCLARPSSTASTFLLPAAATSVPAPTAEPSRPTAELPRATPEPPRATPEPPNTVREGRVVVSCNFVYDSLWAVQNAFASGDHGLIDMIADSCHRPVDGTMELCAFVPAPEGSKPTPREALRECLGRAPPVEFAIYDTLGPYQIEEWVEIELNGQFIGSIHIYEGKSSSLLTVAIPSAGPQHYRIVAKTTYNRDERIWTKERVATRVIDVSAGDVFELVGYSMDSPRMWLEDQTLSDG